MTPAVLLITCVCGASSLLAQGQTQSQPPPAKSIDDEFNVLQPPPAQSTDTIFNRLFGQPARDVPLVSPTPRGRTSDIQTASNGPEGIPLSEQGGTLVVPVLINGQITLNFTIDSGASYVSIPADVVSVLVRTGTVQKSDFIGQENFTLADGSIKPSATFLIRSLKVGNHVLENVKASVADAKAGLLLGQSFLSQFNSWSIDNKRQVLLLNPPADGPRSAPQTSDPLQPALPTPTYDKPPPWPQKAARIALKSGESTELRNFYAVQHCQSILIGPPVLDVLESPKEVTVTFKDGAKLPTNCTKLVPGGTVIATAKEIKTPKEAKLTIRLKFGTWVGERQTSNSYILSLFP